MKKVPEFLIAVVRTSIVPPIVGFAAAHLPFLPIDKVTVAVTFLISGIYYIILHGIEVAAKNPSVKKWAGIFLGYAKQPAYSVPSALEIEEKK